MTLCILYDIIDVIDKSIVLIISKNGGILMKKIGVAFRGIILFLVLCLCFTSCAISYTAPGEAIIYNCNVKQDSVRTKIKIHKNKDFFATVSGKFITFLTDPLTMYDKNENSIAYAGDAYHFINQDSHGIYVDEKLTYEMVGLYKFWGEKYELYDAEENLVATLSFNEYCTLGEIYNTDKVLIAKYVSAHLRKDFDIIIYEDCDIDDVSIIMVFCSYYSDYAADHS